MAEETKNTENQAEKPAERTYTAEEYNALKAQLDEAGRAAKDWKTRAEQAEKERADFEHRTKLSQYVKNLNLKNDVYESHVLNLLKEKGLKFEGDKLIGGDDGNSLKIEDICINITNRHLSRIGLLFRGNLRCSRIEKTPQST